MVIDPYNREVSEIYELTNTTLNLNEIRNLEKKDEKIEAVGPKEHLEALRRDLLKAGYRKLK